MSTLSVLEGFDLFHITQGASQEIAAWTEISMARRPNRTVEDAAYISELTSLAAMEYAAFFHLVERTLTQEGRALQVDERAARAAAARYDSSPEDCYAISRFVRGEARVDDLFLFTSDLQKIQATSLIDVTALANASDLSVIAKAVDAYSQVFDGTWIAGEAVVLARIPAVWFARWCLNNAASIAGAEADFRSSLLQFPDLFRLLAPA